MANISERARLEGLGLSFRSRTRRSQPEDVPKKYFSFMEFTAADLPETYEEAVSGPHKRDWLVAMDKEMSSIYENVTWKEVQNTGHAHF